MWLFNSSIGRKLVMSITGACLILFVTFHVLMNSVAIFWPVAYNQICEFLGANWYALIASMGLAFLFIVHIAYAFLLTMQNRKARGGDRYAVTSRPPQVEWASKNMLVLGIVICAFLLVHLIQFWAKMQWQELRHAELSALPQLDGVPVEPAQGTLFLQMAFSQVWTPIVYIIGFAALWFHMNHGFWSMFQSAGWNNQTWLPRMKKIACWWTTIVIGLFVIQVLVFTVRAKQNYYTQNPELQAQYAETLDKKADAIADEISFGNAAINEKIAQAEKSGNKMTNEQIAELKKNYYENEGLKLYDESLTLRAMVAKRCSNINLQESGLYLGFMRLEFLSGELFKNISNAGVKIPDEIMTKRLKY